MDVLLFISVATLLLQAAAPVSAQESEFFMGFLRNFNGDSLYTRLIITSSSPATVMASTLRGELYSGYVSGDSPVTINIAQTNLVNDLMDRNKGIRIVTNSSTVSVVAANVNKIDSSGGTSAAYRILPRQFLPEDVYQYFAVSVGTQPQVGGIPRASEVLVVGTENDTTVTIYPSQTLTLPTANGSLVDVEPGSDGHNVTLHYLETLLMRRNGGDLTATRIVSNKPLSVISGHECGNVPVDVGRCDHVGVHTPPTANWGRTFLLVPFLGRPAGQNFKIVSARNSTEVELCNGSTLVLGKGGVHEFHTDPYKSCYLRSNNPLLVVQLSLGRELDGIGDPAMMMVSPMEQYVNSLTYHPLSRNDFKDNYLTVTTMPRHFTPTSVLLDGKPIQCDWSVLYSGETVVGYSCRLSTSSLAHTLKHHHPEGKLSALVYGFDTTPWHAYGYLPGMNSLPLNSLPVFSLELGNVTSVEEGSIFTIHIRRSAVINTNSSVSVADTGSVGAATAAGSHDYSVVPKEVVFQPGEELQSVLVTVEDDNLTEPSEVIAVHLVDTQEVMLGASRELLFNIVDNDVVTVGISDYSIHNMSAASFTLELTEGTLQEGLEVEVQLTVELVQPGVAHTSTAEHNNTVTFTSSSIRHNLTLSLATILPQDISPGDDTYLLFRMFLTDPSQDRIAHLNQNVIIDNAAMFLPLPTSRSASVDSTSHLLSPTLSQYSPTTLSAQPSSSASLSALLTTATELPSGSISCPLLATPSTPPPEVITSTLTLYTSQTATKISCSLTTTPPAPPPVVIISTLTSCPLQTPTELPREPISSSRSATPTALSSVVINPTLTSYLLLSIFTSTIPLSTLVPGTGSTGTQNSNYLLIIIVLGVVAAMMLILMVIGTVVCCVCGCVKKSKSKDYDF